MEIKYEKNITDNCARQTAQNKQDFILLFPSVRFFARNRGIRVLREKKIKWCFGCEIGNCSIYYVPHIKNILEQRQNELVKNPIKYSFYNAFAIFPEAKTVIKIIERENLTTLKTELSAVMETERAYISEVVEKWYPPYRHADLLVRVRDGFEELARSIRSDIVGCEIRLSFLSDKKTTSDKGFITPDMVLRAKQYPIGSLVSFGRDKKAGCLWHDDKTPSMHYYADTNSVYCFACAKGGDAIDVYRALYGVSFGQAVKALI